MLRIVLHQYDAIANPPLNPVSLGLYFYSYVKKYQSIYYAVYVCADDAYA